MPSNLAGPCSGEMALHAPRVRGHPCRCSLGLCARPAWLLTPIMQDHQSAAIVSLNPAHAPTHNLEPRARTRPVLQSSARVPPGSSRPPIRARRAHSSRKRRGGCLEDDVAGGRSAAPRPKGEIAGGGPPEQAIVLVNVLQVGMGGAWVAAAARIAIGCVVELGSVLQEAAGCAGT